MESYSAAAVTRSCMVVARSAFYRGVWPLKDDLSHSISAAHSWVVCARYKHDHAVSHKALPLRGQRNLSTLKPQVHTRRSVLGQTAVLNFSLNSLASGAFLQSIVAYTTARCEAAKKVKSLCDSEAVAKLKRRKASGRKESGNVTSEKTTKARRSRKTAEVQDTPRVAGAAGVAALESEAANGLGSVDSLNKETTVEQLGAFYFPFDGIQDSEDSLASVSAGEETQESATDSESEHEQEEPGQRCRGPHRVTKMDSFDGRFYRVVVPRRETYDLPSVTTVLRVTQPKSSFFSLRNWRKSMIKEHGEEGYRRIHSERLQAGTAFHQVRKANKPPRRSISSLSEVT